jgi:hypothetical protein
MTVWTHIGNLLIIALIVAIVWTRQIPRWFHYCLMAGGVVFIAITFSGISEMPK